MAIYDGDGDGDGDDGVVMVWYDGDSIDIGMC